MCGIFAALNSSLTLKKITPHFNKLKHRGPDNSNIDHKNSVILGFHRLCINGLGVESMQPMVYGCPDSRLICNGEIFNYKKLCETYGFNLTSGSDCEVILHLYNYFGRGVFAFKKMLSLLDAEFAIILHDEKLNILFIARDPFGVRPLFWSTRVNASEITEIYIASELKALNFCERVVTFLPANFVAIDVIRTKYTNYTYNIILQKYYRIPFVKKYLNTNLNDIHSNINNLLKSSVKKRLMSDRPVGCLLSGGVDSSLITALVSKLKKKVDCFTVGLKNSVDIKYAKRVVAHLNANGGELKHHIVNFTVKEGFEILESVIYSLETMDVTTIRAAIPQYLLAKYIKEHTDITVLLSGEGADELFNSYLYSRFAPSPEALVRDSKRLISELYLYDNLRTDRTMAAWSLEVRIPFLDTHLVNYLSFLNPKYRISNGNIIEKKILRDAFKMDNLLPLDVLYRQKAALSDAVSSVEESWYLSLQQLIDEFVSDQDMVDAKKKFIHMTPFSKESYYYRCIFNKLFPNRSKIIPKFWMPKWVETSDPSATTLFLY